MFSAFRDKLRFWRSEFDGHYSTLQGRVQGKPAVLAGELLGGLRSQLITTPEVSYRAGISNAGLVKTSDGYLAIAKNNTYCFCQELGVDSDFGPNDKPARARLLLVELDDALRVTRVRRLALEVDGREYDDEADLREDARLSVFGSEIWCSVNLVPQGNQWRAEPVLGRLDLGSARLIAKTM
ncbi:MAG TPA: hypothetical protein VHM25_18235, partial [Polyangiaceae bacterium]|nr:hypothetical protein [Polyangiaceae bacterium]